MKSIQRFSISSILVIVMFSLSIIAYATPVTGTKIAYCNLSFTIQDSTNEFEEEIKVIMKDIAGDNIFEYKLTKPNSYGGTNIPKYTVLANTTYEVSFEMNNDYTVVNADGSAITNFGATEKGHDFNWKIISLKENNEIDNPIMDIENEVMNESTIQGYNTGNEEADQVFKAFYEAVKGIDNNPHWEWFLNIYKAYEALEVQDYIKYVGGTEEEWSDKSLFDRFIYYESYLRLADYASSGNYTRYFETKEVYDRNVVNTQYVALKRYGEAEAEAYKKLMDWQYNYIKQNNAPYNFITGFNLLQKKQIEEEREVKEKEKLEQISKGYEEIQKELKEEVEQEVKEELEQASVWDSVIDKIANNFISIIILFVFGIGVIGFMIYRKMNNVDDTYDN